VEEDEAKKRIARGTWKLLETPSDLLVALRDRRGGLWADLTGLHPKGAVLAGDLSEMQPGDLLNFLHQGRRTGVLLSRVGEVERAIALCDGNLAWACSTTPGERLGELLARLGLADRGRIESALREQASSLEHRRIGQVLVDAGVLGSEEVGRGLRHQLVEIFLGLLVAREGSFVFLTGLDRTALPVVLGLDTEAMLLDGLRRLDEMEVYRARVPHADVIPHRTGKEPAGAVTAEQKQVLALSDGVRTLGDVAVASALGEFETTKAVFQLVEQGVLRLGPNIVGP
jgi:hypothetical protein